MHSQSKKFENARMLKLCYAARTERGLPTVQNTHGMCRRTCRKYVHVIIVTHY